MARFPIRKQIKIQRLQDKHRMVGAAFNPSGVTVEDLQAKRAAIVARFKAMTHDERMKYWENLQSILEVWEGSHQMEWNVFTKHFVDKNQQVIASTQPANEKHRTTAHSSLGTPTF